MRTRLADDVAALGTRFRSASHVPVACARVHVRIRLFVRFLAFSLQFIAANRVIFIDPPLESPTPAISQPALHLRSTVCYILLHTFAIIAKQARVLLRIFGFAFPRSLASS